MRNQPEKIIQQQIVTLLRSIGATVYVLGVHRRRGDYPGTMQTPGLPDLYAFLPFSLGVSNRDGVVEGSVTPNSVWIEVKAPGGRLSEAQWAFRIACVTKSIGHVIGGVDEVLAFLVAGGWLKADGVAHYRRPAAHSEVTR
jgi:hypothetical protein